MKIINSFLRLSGLILLLMAFTQNSFAGTSPDKIKGKAVYADDLSPVRGGTIEVVSTNTPLIGTIVLEKVTIKSDGTFLISRNCLNQTDDIKIMAYPNDVDGAIKDFEPAGFSPADVIVQTREDYSLLIKVVRSSGAIEQKDKK